jgi:hypothetical protein
MPLIPDDTQPDTGSRETSASNDGEKDISARLSALTNSKYLKPVGAALLALGAGYLVRLFRRRKSP